MAALDTDVRFIKGVGERRAKALLKLGVRTLYDLARLFPRAYEDRSEIRPVSALMSGDTVCVNAVVCETPRTSRIRAGLELTKLRAADDTGSVHITFFNQSYLKDKLKSGGDYIFYGKIGGEHGYLTMTNPVFEPVENSGRVTGRVVPVYPLTAGLSQNVVAGAVQHGLDECDGLFPDCLPESVRLEEGLCHVRFAYRNIHFPENLGTLELARRRLVFEEFFVLACALGRMRSDRERLPGHTVPSSDFSEFYASLPFQPTNAQKRAVNEAARDMASGLPMNRLVQGDVGSGKTLVAAALVWLTWKAGLQSAFMAPTEVLARQHADTLTAMLEPLGLRVALLTGSMTVGQKRTVRENLALGLIDLVIGTHALISGGVEFMQLGLVVTDEQHRFGVSQRAALGEKGVRPHVLVMSATPIPRTLSLIIYGDLDVSVLDEMPPGRQSVDTFAVGESMRTRINRFIVKLVSEGRQVFVVCPRIEENEDSTLSLKSAEEHASYLQAALPELSVACMHGKLKAAEKEAVMSAFVRGETDVLVSTTVIEVGVDVPNTALIVVENAERFGLSQLHQLRGRVGRGEHKSYCVLFSGALDDSVARSRLDIMRKTTDGFKIAEEDLKLRGPGDFFGSRQHGLPKLDIADLCSDMDVLARAKDAAKRVLGADPRLELPEHKTLLEAADKLFDPERGILA